MSVSHEETWRTASNPRHLLRMTRVRSNGRRYLLLTCAVVRQLMPGVRSGVGGRVLDKLEQFAVAQPARGVRTHLWRDVVRRELPEVPDPLPWSWPEIGNDFGWIWQLGQRLDAFSSVRPAIFNVMLDRVRYEQRLYTAREATAEANALTSRLGLPQSSGRTGWLGGLVGTRTPLAVSRQLIGDVLDEVAARVPPERRAAVRASWVETTDVSVVRQRVKDALVHELVTRQLETVDARACELMREVFGNPFHKPVIDPAWLACNHGAVGHIAEQIAASGSFADLPILADALEDAGCREEELLRHCREGRTHVPGCWALDAVLGRG